MRTWKRKHPKYGYFEVDGETLNDVIANFKENKRGIDLAVDENHEPNHIALWRIRELSLEGNDKLFARIELTDLGASKLWRGEYKYFSPEIIREDTDNETGDPIRNLLIGGAFTNRPYFKDMQSLQATEVSDSNEDTQFYFFDKSPIMDELKKLLQALLDKETLEDADMSQADAMYAERNGKDDPTVAEMYASVVSKKDAQAQAKIDADLKAKADDASANADDKTGDKATFTDPATGKTKTVSFAEFTAMQEKLDAYAFAEKQKNVSDKLSGLVFSETNKMSVVLPKSIDKMTKFALSLNETQFAQFCEIVKGFNTEAGSMFSEEWKTGDATDDGATGTRSEKVEAKAQELMKATPTMKYREAVLEANKLFAEEDEDAEEEVQ